MEVILKKDIPALGRIGEIVRVREGYARNYLIPRSLAMMASASNRSQLEHHKLLVAVHKRKVQKESQELVESKKGLKAKLTRRFNESGKMYGAVTASDLVEEFTKLGLTADKRDLDFVSPKAPGPFEVKVRFPGDVILSVSVTLEAELEHADKEAKAKKGTKSRKAKSKDDTADAEVETESAKSGEASASEEA